MKDRKRRERMPRRKNRTGESDEVKIYISPVMFVMALYFVAMGMTYEFFCSLAAVLLHECAHAKVAKKLGYELNMIKLMPYGAALCGAENIEPKHEIAIAVAGPLFNLVFATAFAALWWLAPSSYMFTEAFCKCNLFVGAFNILPVYPLDGGRVLLALLSLKCKRAKAYKIMRVISAVFGLLALSLFVLSVFYAPNICLLSVGIFMLVSAFIPDRRAQYTALFARSGRRERLKAPLEMRTFAVSENAELASLVKALDADRYSEFVVLGDDSLDEIGRIDETRLTEELIARGYSARAGDVVDRRRYARGK